MNLLVNNQLNSSLRHIIVTVMILSIFQVADGIMKIYDTNLCKFDCLAIKTCLLLYMYLNVEQVKTRPLVLMLEQLICNLSDVTLFGKQLRLLKKSSNSTVTKSMVSMMACLSSDYHHFQGNLLRSTVKAISSVRCQK